MRNDVDYNSLMEEFENIKNNKRNGVENNSKPQKSSYKKIKEYLTGKGYERGSKDKERRYILNLLKDFNECMTKGEFFDGEEVAKLVYWGLNEKSFNGYENPLSKEERLKYLDPFNKRIERGLNYLKKHPSKVSEKNLGYVESILKSSKDIEKGLKGRSSGLEKSVTAVSIVAVIEGIFFLSPNITGSVIGSMARSSSNILGAVLFIAGITGAFFISRK